MAIKKEVASREEALRIQGGVRALEKLLEVGLNQAHITRLIHGEEAGQKHKTQVFDLIGPLLDAERKRLELTFKDGLLDAFARL
ncbi:hypothetical protein ACTEV4_000063 [Cronobacter turicensis]|nr:hypothetical protein [Cronobacter sakazakii]EGT5754744.1 hypothetical protein [Cronobacter sakazakii]EJG0818354.1 hypothetical protein [Cronobacter sakazakii]EJG2181063.1 hypothetical protein [Cronobacter sakazakii]EMA8648084.1 hypothetical protein [Cronobacter turicensis]